MLNDLTVSGMIADCKLAMDYFLYIFVGLLVFPLDKSLFYEGKMKLQLPEND